MSDHIDSTKRLLRHLSLDAANIATSFRRMAKEGDIELLQLALETGTLANHNDDLVAIEVAAAVCPVVEAVPLARQAEANQFVDDWFDAMGVDDIELRSILAASKDPATARLLMAKGVSPNDESDSGVASPMKLTVLGEKLLMMNRGDEATDKMQALLVMVDRLTAQGQMPLFALPAMEGGSSKTIFEWILEIPDANDDVLQKLLWHLGSTDIPASWRANAGAALLRLAGDAIDYSDWTGPLLALTLALSDLEGDAAWASLMGAGASQADLFARLLSDGMQMKADAGLELASRIVRNALRQGVHPDAVPGCIYTETADPATWLQIAAYFDRADLVQLLLENGADSDRSLSVLRNHVGGNGVTGYVRKDALGLAMEAGADNAVKVLEAWQAKQAIQSVLSRSQMHSKIA